jgi:RNA polymerase sigma-70 factor, ECF subfamily
MVDGRMQVSLAVWAGPILPECLACAAFFARSCLVQGGIGYGYQVSGVVRYGRSGLLRLVRPEAGAEPPASRQALDDHTLVAAARAGDPGVASILCDRLWPRIDRTIRRLVGAHDVDRDDLGQMAMMELVGSIGRYRAECSLDTWTQAVTANIVFAHLRRRRVERRIFADILVDDERVGMPVQGDRRLGSREVLMRIGKHLDGMNEPQAWAYVLHDLLGYDLREVSEMTKVSVAAAQSRLVRGRRELHERIANDPERAGAAAYRLTIRRRRRDPDARGGRVHRAAASPGAMDPA